jgi:hypothetical protein
MQQQTDHASAMRQALEANEGIRAEARSVYGDQLTPAQCLDRVIEARWPNLPERAAYAAAADHYDVNVTHVARFTKILDAAGVHIISHDDLTDLDWPADDLGSFSNEAEDSEAEDACAALDLGGFTDWRLPTIDELESIRDRSRCSPAIDTEFFPDCPSDWFWSSTAHAYGPAEYAWVVGFYYGSSLSGGRDGRYRVRAVRGPSRQFSAPLPSGSEG